MTTSTPATIRTPTFTAAQRRTLRSLRARYQQDQDRFSTRERADLTFLRWLYQTNGLGAGHALGPAATSLGKEVSPQAV